MESWRSIWSIYLLFFVCSVSFAQLPRLTTAPTAGILSSDGVTVLWQAWSPDTDEGIGPVIGYVVEARNTLLGDVLSIDAGTSTSIKVDQLTFEQDYDITVTCVASNGRGDPSPVLSVTIPCGVPTEAPVLTSLESVNKTALILSWTNPPQESWRCSNLDDIMISYEYKLDEDSDFPTSSDNPKAPLADGELVIGGLEACGQYEVVALMYASTTMEYSSEMSNVINGTTELDLVGMVSNPSSTGQANIAPNFILTWQPPSEGLCKPDSYMITYAVVQRLACPDPVENIAAMQETDILGSPYLLNNLEFYAEYEINITGVNALGIGETFSHRDSTRGGVPSSAPMPSLMEELAAPGELHFNWTALPCEEVQGVFRRYLYELYEEAKRDRIEFGQNRNIDDLETSFTGLKGCTVFNFRVRVTNAGGVGPFSELLPVTTPTEAPGFVGNLMVSPSVDSPTSLNASWVPDTTTPCRPDEYNLEYTLKVLDRCEDVDISPVALPAIPVSDLSYVVEDLEPYSEYVVSVYASNSGGNSSKVEKVVFTGEQAPTGTPSDIVAYTVEYNKLAFYFSELPCGTRHGDITVYNFKLRQVDTDEVIMTGTTDQTRVTLEGLARDTEYGIMISAENGAGPGSFSEEVLQYTALGLPSEPLGLATYDSPSALMPLTWQPPAKPNGAITRYDIQYWESATEGAEPTSIEFTDVNANQLRLMITDVEPLKEYTFKISATNEAGEGYWSNNFTQLIEEGAPSRVVDLTVTEIMEEAITIEWSEPLEPRGIISKYIVQYVVSDRPYYENEVAEKSTTVLLAPDVTTFEITDLEPATEYSIKVLARTSKKEGESSMVKQFTLPPEDIPEPENVMIVSADVSEDGTIIVKLPPISYKYATAYQIGVHCKDVESEPTFFDGENSTDCSYIAGEVPNMEEEQEFIVGDGKKYGNYENKLLKKDMEYDIYVSIVTRTSEGAGVSWGAEPLEAEEKSSAGLIILWIFIVILLIIIILIVIWCVYSYRKKQQNEKKPPSTPEEDVPLK